MNIQLLPQKLAETLQSTKPAPNEGDSNYYDYRQWVRDCKAIGSKLSALYDETETWLSYSDFLAACTCPEHDED